jgi:hypothetical protein
MGWTAGVQFLAEVSFFSSPQCQDRLWDPSRLLPNGHRGVKKPGREADYSPPPRPMSSIVELYLHSPIHLHGLVLPLYFTAFKKRMIGLFWGP